MFPSIRAIKIYFDPTVLAPLKLNIPYGLRRSKPGFVLISCFICFVIFLLLTLCISFMFIYLSVSFFRFCHCFSYGGQSSGHRTRTSLIQFFRLRIATFWEFSSKVNNSVETRWVALEMKYAGRHVKRHFCNAVILWSLCKEWILLKEDGLCHDSGG
jgi:hypothetical protein